MRYFSKLHVRKNVMIIRCQLNLFLNISLFMLFKRLIAWLHYGYILHEKQRSRGIEKEKGNLRNMKIASNFVFIGIRVLAYYYVMSVTRNSAKGKTRSRVSDLDLPSSPLLNIQCPLAPNGKPRTLSTTEARLIVCFVLLLFHRLHIKSKENRNGNGNENAGKQKIE